MGGGGDTREKGWGDVVGWRLLVGQLVGCGAGELASCGLASVEFGYLSEVEEDGRE